MEEGAWAMMIPIANPKASYLACKELIDDAVFRVLESGWYVLGKEVSDFERSFAQWCGCSHAVGVANGTDAVEIALRSVGVHEGDCVVTVSNTANATVSAIERIGAVPVFVDVREDTYTMDPGSLSEALMMRGAKAVVPVHLYGHPADMPAICSIAHGAGAAVVEDCAQAHGATICGRKVGTFGDAAAFSFYPTKNLGAIGDGGAVVSSDNAVADRVMLLRQYGWRKRYESESKGVNSRLDEIQAAILSVKLKSLALMNGRRRQIAEFYNREFSKLPIELPLTGPGCEHVYHQYTLLCDRRDDVVAHLKLAGVGTGILYPVPIHKQPAYIDDFSDVILPVTESLADRIVSIPVYPELTDDEVHRVVHAVKSFFVKT